MIRSVGNKAIVLFQNQLFLKFSNSPDLATGILNAIMDAFSAHSAMSKQALESEKVRSGLKDVGLGPSELRAKSEAAKAAGQSG